jgi:DNA-binding phage protein
MGPICGGINRSNSSAKNRTIQVALSTWRAAAGILINMRILDDKDIVRLLRSEVERAGGQSAWARREGIDRTLLNRILNGQRPPTKEIIRALKLCNAYTLHDDAFAN